jgi:hypothetical protein
MDILSPTTLVVGKVIVIENKTDISQKAFAKHGIGGQMKNRPKVGEIWLTTYQIVQIVSGSHVIILDCDYHKTGCCQGSHAYLCESDEPIFLLEEAQ